MSLKHGILGLLNYGSMTGYELDKAFKASLTFFWQAKTSQIYRELDAMEQRGWLTSERVVQTEKPNKRIYTITDRGKKELSNWLALPDTDIADAMSVKSAFLMRVFFGGEIDLRDSIEMIRTYRDQCLKSKEDLQVAHTASSDYGITVGNDHKSKFWDLSILYGESFYNAGIAWANQAITMLEEEKE